MADRDDISDMEVHGSDPNGGEPDHGGKLSGTNNANDNRGDPNQPGKPSAKGQRDATSNGTPWGNHGTLSAEELISLSLETGQSISVLLREGYLCSEPESAQAVQMLSTLLNRRLDRAPDRPATIFGEPGLSDHNGHGSKKA